METADWNDLFDDDDESASCLSQEVCVEDLLRDAAAGCFYCRLTELDAGDDE